MEILIRRGTTIFFPRDAEGAKEFGEEVKIEVKGGIATCNNPCREGSSIRLGTSRGLICQAVTISGGMSQRDSTPVSEKALCGMVE